MKKEQTHKGDIFLWLIVIMLCFFVGMTHFAYKLGQGRWECVENKTICSNCNMVSTGVIVAGLMEYKCNCTEYKRECIKEVWTRK